MSDILAAEAIRSYDEFFRICVEQPNLATYTNAKINLKISEPSELWTSYKTNDSRYIWFVAYALKVFDDILLLAPCYMSKNNIRYHLEFHTESIVAIWDSEWKHTYSKKLDKIVQRIIKANLNA